MKTSVALIGFMGAGKTAVGRELAAMTGREFIEADALIEQRAGKTIPEVFRQDGEITFREVEIMVAKEVAAKKNVVIACGGGMVLNRINIDRLKIDCIIVYLTASPGVILKRTSVVKNGRPLLDVADRATQIRELLKFRRPFYERAADIKINTSRLGTAAVAELVIQKLKEYEDKGK